MSEPSAGPNSNSPTPTGLVLLHALSGDAQTGFRVVAERLGVEAIVSTRIEDCAVFAEGARGVCIITPAFPSLNSRLADRADRSFRRTTVIAVTPSSGEAELWRRLLWDAVSIETPAIEVERRLEAALHEAEQRRHEWDLVDDFHRRRDTLTAAEEDVLVAVCNGKLNKQIASELGVSIRTVEQRRRKVFSKMAVPSAIPLADRVATVRTLEGYASRRDAAHAPRRPPAGQQAGFMAPVQRQLR